MKRNQVMRLMVLAALCLALLVVAMAPIFINTPDFSFEADANHDGVPDYWRVRGDVIYDCDHPAKAHDGDCMMVFPPSSKRAAVFTRYLPLLEPAEEVTSQGYVETAAAAKNLQANKAFVGMKLIHDGAVTVTIYKAIPGGSYDWQYAVKVYNGVEIGDYPPDNAILGYLVFPHYGTVAVDLFDAYVCDGLCGVP